MSIKYWETRAEAEARRATAAVDILPLPKEEDTGNTDDQSVLIEETEVISETEPETEITLETEPETEIVDITEVRKEHDDRERINREVDEFFEEEAKRDSVPVEENDKKNGVGKILKYIFVDGLLGIPFLAIVCVLVSVLVVAFSLISTVLFVGALACVAGAVILIINSFTTVGIHPQTGFFTFGASLALIGIGLLLFVLAILVSSKVVPFIASLVDRLARKLRLFKN